MGSYDAIVVGAGHNGLAAGIVLAKAGWKVLILERSQQPGGAVCTAEVTLPGFRHDLFATNLNLFAGSPFLQEFQTELVDCGLSFVPAPKAFASLFPNGDFLGVGKDLQDTLRSIEAVSQRDSEAWKNLFLEFQRWAPYLFPLMAVPMPSLALARGLWKGARALGHQWPLELGRLLLQSPREFLQDHFHSPQVQALAASWGMHLDFPPDMPGGALFSYLESMAAQDNGMVLGHGGASNMIQSLTRLFESLGGELRCGCPVERIGVEARKARRVETAGEAFEARRAIIANLAPPLLFGTLVQDGLTDAFLRKVHRYRFGPGTMMLHLALSDLPRWSVGEAARDYVYLHIGPYMDDMSRVYQEAVSGQLPVHPCLVVGQPTVVDPSRAPEGRHILWVQVRMLPTHIAGDAAGKIEERTWEKVKEPYAQRVIDTIESYAPGIRDCILDQAVFSPQDLESHNPNLVGGDSLAGSHHLMQNYIFRPFLGFSRYRTPIGRLYMCGASTWPGAGVGAVSGYLLGKMLV